MKFFLIVTATVLCLTGCGPDEQPQKQEQHATDSLIAKINSPELKALNQQLLENPNNPELYNKRAKLYLSLHLLDEALGDSKRALSIDSTKADYYLTVADVYFAHNNTRQAKDVLEKIEVKFPDNTDGLLKLAELFFIVHQYEKAFAKINTALKLNENLPKAYYLKGSIYRETGDTNKAISSMVTAVEQDNRYFNAFMDIGLIYAARHNPLAIEYYDNAISIEPANPEPMYAKAKFLQDEGNYDDATALYEQILKTTPAHAHTLYNMGALEFAVKKDPKKAIDYFSKAINADPQYVEAYYARGACYEDLKDKKNAVADYTMCLQLRPNYQPAVEGLESAGKL